jgi:hypothetical protein
MVSFDRSRETFIENKIKEQVEATRTGKVIRVYEHDNAEDTSNFEADVSVEGGTRQQRLSPISTGTADTISVPKVGDSVRVAYLSGETDTPVITGFVHTTRDRAPLGKAGMDRKRIESGDSPAGSGDLYTTEYTSYDGDPSQTDSDDLTPEEVFVQIAKRSNDEADPSEESDIPAKVGFYDAPSTDEAHITVELNKRDSSDSTASWGMKFNLKTGEVKLVDPVGTGFVSDGDRNWTWEYISKTENQVTRNGNLSI